MTPLQKGKSPFYPGQPVPVDLFVGRAEQIKRILDRGVGQAASGKPIAMYVQGEYGIGKSSIAGFVQWIAEREFGLHGIYTSLGAVEELMGVGAAILEATVRSGAFNPNRSEKIRNWLSKYVGEQSVFGVTIHADELKKDAPTIISGLLPFLREALDRLKDTGIKGIFLVLDEINGITANPKFAHLIKEVIDTNAMSRDPLPLLLMLCGVEDRRRDMIRHHQPIDRIFDVIEIDPMSLKEMSEFFEKAFVTVQVKLLPEAAKLMSEYSAGFPKIMHLVGDCAFWIDQDGVIDKADAYKAVVMAAEEVGKKYVDQQVYKALKSADYHSILKKIARMGPDAVCFRKADVISGLTETEKKKFDNFLQKMKRLNVLRSGDVQGEYVFRMRMVQFYIWLQSLERS